ncbi:MAG TPA: type IV pilus secretin PilQ [Vicinamibacterales bacterium]|nr:type IV pilus secretin PilQ [Vicinamibacterales bacterium]
MRNMRLWMLTLVVAISATLVTVGAQAPQAQTDQTQQGLRRWSGTPIDVDYQSANLRSVLRNLAEIGGINLILDVSVPTTATVDLKLTQVPWDQVMDVVMKSGALTYEIEGPVLRVLTRDALTKEKQAEVDQRRVTRQAGELSTARVRLNYASASEVKKLLETARIISAEGTVDVDERTNMLIIKDSPKQVEEVQKVIADLDKPEPQVEIEAKIIQTNRDTAKEIGVQWGLNGRMTPDLGNTTGLGFPNSGTLGGRVTQQGPVTQGPTDPRATPTERTGTAINMPATGATSALGLSLGAINGAFGIDVAISALERQGKVKILSTPRVTTQNNKEAQVTQGFQIPIQTTQNNTVSVQFKDAALKLMVTPQITGANTVIMKIILENGQPDFSRAVNGNPSINTQRAETSVQVPDGITTAIGGILQTSETMSEDKTPGASRIPLLGWLFKRSSNSNVSQELLIFITPRIIRGQP